MIERKIMKVILMSGIPGSGKSTYIDRLIREDPEKKFCICSADHYFQTDSSGRYDPEAEYRFDPTKLSDAHGACIRKFVEEIVPGSKNSSWADVIVVDNTNTTTMELAVYVQVAMAYKVPVEIVTIYCDPHSAAERNLHGVSYQACSRMDANIRNRAIPTFWNVTTTNLPKEDD
jgi:tRNA uridine 5-carbamoylmethylation protein Kti12